MSIKFINLKNQETAGILNFLKTPDLKRSMNEVTFPLVLIFAIAASSYAFYLVVSYKLFTAAGYKTWLALGMATILFPILLRPIDFYSVNERPVSKEIIKRHLNNYLIKMH